MIRRTLGLWAGWLLLGPVSCLDDVEPDPFTTENTCFPGESIECDCASGEMGSMTCDDTGRLGDCRCPACTVDDCVAPPDVLMSRACCSDQNECGFTFAGACLRPGQEGRRHNECPPVSVDGIDLDGCCRRDGTCGGLEDVLGLGCIDANELNGDPAVRCTP